MGAQEDKHQDVPKMQNEEMEMRHLMPLALLILFAGASIEIAPPTPEVHTKKNQPLMIMCPKCHRPMYVCKVSEIFNGEHSLPSICFPVSKDIPALIPGSQIFCPIDKGNPFIAKQCEESPNGICNMVYTNRGWLPKRNRKRGGQ